MLHPGARTVNVAIGLRSRRPKVSRRDHTGFRVRQGDAHWSRAASAAELATHPDGRAGGHGSSGPSDAPPLEVVLKPAALPGAAGLGASSALSVALLAAVEALSGRTLGSGELSYHRVAALIRDVEARLMELPTGMQDHYPGLLGGALEIEYLPGGHRVRRLDVDLPRLAESLLVVYTGRSHFSAGSNWQVVRRRLDGDPETVELFQGISEVAAAIPAPLEAGDFAVVGELMGREWSFRRRLADGVSTPEIEALLAAASEAGAWGGKVTGAGGGGCVAILAPPERREEVIGSVTAAGGQVLDAPPRAEPLRLEVGED